MSLPIFNGALIAAAQDVLTEEVRPLSPVETKSPRPASILASTVAFDSGHSDPIVVRMEMDPNRQLAKSLALQFGSAEVAVPPAILRCIENPDPRSVSLVLGYVDKDLPGAQSIARVTIAVDSGPTTATETVQHATPAQLGVRVQYGEIVAAWVYASDGKPNELDLDNVECGESIAGAR